MSETQEPEQIRTMEKVRKVRDAHAEALKGKSTEEVVALFNRAGKDARRHMDSRAPAHQAP